MKEIFYQNRKYQVTGETPLFYICEPEEVNEQTAYIPKGEVKEVVAA
jgi:hypothetical protein